MDNKIWQLIECACEHCRGLGNHLVQVAVVAARTIAGGACIACARERADSVGAGCIQVAVVAPSDTALVAVDTLHMSQRHPHGVCVSCWTRPESGRGNYARLRGTERQQGEGDHDGER